MAIQRLYRVILRQRVNWTGLPLGMVDGTSVAAIKPTEIEGYSIEKDITAYVADYKCSSSLEALSSEATLDLLNPDGILTPDNTKSDFNWTVLNGIKTYTPLLARGAEIQIYRVVDAAYLDPSFRHDKTKWKPRFRGEIKTIKYGTTGGQDSLQVVLGDALYRANKATLTGSFSPIMRSSSQCPGNSFYTLPTLVSAVTNHFRDTPAPQRVMDPNGNFTPPSFAEPGEIPDYMLARLFYWDRDDYFRSLGKTLTVPYFLGSTYEDETADSLMTWVPANESTATAVWMLNGNSWFVESGTVVKDALAENVFEDPQGSLKLTGASLRHTVRRLPGNLPSRVTFGYKLADDVSSITVRLVKRQFDRSTLSYVDAGSTVYAATLQGKTACDSASLAEVLGGTLLNAPTDVSLMWRRANLDPLPNIDPDTWEGDDELKVITLFELRLEVSGTAWIDLPRWEFISVDKNADGTSFIRDNNITNYPCRERWITTDGITYTDPYPGHRALSKKNIQVVMRSLMNPYAAGTDFGYGPAHMRNRSLPEHGLYERELQEGQDFEILFDKGAIKLAFKHPQVEIFVRHTEYDLAASGHMEAAEMLKLLLVRGMGHNPDKILLEPTGIILSRISLDATTSTSIAKAIQEIKQQIPANYYIHADGDGNIIGRFIQQSGSPRILNPIKQAPVKQLAGGALELGGEYWYAVTSLMPDGKETLPSNLMATVDYFNYFDATHKSTIEAGMCPALCLKPVPNQVGFVVRRAKAYKSAADTVVSALPEPKARWEFAGTQWATDVKQGAVLAGDLASAIQVTTVDISATGPRRGGKTSRPTIMRRATEPGALNANNEYTFKRVNPDLDALGETGDPSTLTMFAQTKPTEAVLVPTTDTRTKVLSGVVDLRHEGQETRKVAIRFELQLPLTPIHPEAPGGFEIFRLGPANTNGTISIKYVPVTGASQVMPHDLVVTVFGDSPARTVTLRPKIAGVLMEVYVEYDGLTLLASAGGSVDQCTSNVRLDPPSYGASGTPLQFGCDALGVAFDSLELYSTTMATNALSAYTQFPYFLWDQADSGVIAVIPTDPAEVETVLANRSWFTFLDWGYTAGHQGAAFNLATPDTLDSVILYVNEQGVPLAFPGGSASAFVDWAAAQGTITFPWDGKWETLEVVKTGATSLTLHHKRASTVGQLSFGVRLEATKAGGVVVGQDWGRNLSILGKIPQQYLLPHTGQINEGISILGGTHNLTNLKGIQLEQKDESYRTVGKVIGSVKNRPASSAALFSISPINFFGSDKAPFPARSLIYGHPEALSSELPSDRYYSYAVVWERFLCATASATVGSQPMRRAPHNRSRQGDHFAAFSLDIPPGTTLRGISINFVSAPTALEGNAAAGVYPNVPSRWWRMPVVGVNGMVYDWGWGPMRFPQMLSGSGDYSLLFYPMIALDDDGTIWQPIPSLGVDAVKVSGANLWHTITFKQVDYDTLIHQPSGGRLLDGSRRVHLKFVLASEISAVTYQGLSYRVDSQPKKG